MRIRPTLVSLVLCLAGGTAAARRPPEIGDQPGPWYVGFGVGAAFVEESQGFDPDEGFALNGVVGYRIGERGDGRLALSVEAEVFYSEQSLEDAPISFVPGGELGSEDLATTAFFGNLVADWYWTDDIAFYFGGGGGYATDVEILQEEEDGFSWQAKTGLRYYLGGGFSWNVGYRFVSTPEIEDANDFENEIHVAEMGVRWDL